jgi:hypothetical protein
MKVDHTLLLIRDLRLHIRLFSMALAASVGEIGSATRVGISSWRTGIEAIPLNEDCKPATRCKERGCLKLSARLSDVPATQVCQSAI